MATSRSENLLRTTDLPLAAYLVVQGFTPDHLVRTDGGRPGHPQGGWVFKETPALCDVVEEFNNGDALVEPQEFQRVLNSTRRDLFKYLGIGQK